MRTVKVIKSEAEKALIKYNDHYNNCDICQNYATHAEDDMTCHEMEWLYEEYEGLRSDADYAEQVFQQELKERGI